jgi:hypothetical protein
MATVAVQLGSGEDVVKVTLPVPETDEFELNIPLTVKEMRTGGDPFDECVKVFPLIGSGVV